MENKRQFFSISVFRYNYFIVNASSMNGKKGNMMMMMMIHDSGFFLNEFNECYAYIYRIISSRDWSLKDFCESKIFHSSSSSFTSLFIQLHDHFHFLHSVILFIHKESRSFFFFLFILFSFIINKITNYIYRINKQTNSSVFNMCIVKNIL